MHNAAALLLTLTLTAPTLAAEAPDLAVLAASLEKTERAFAQTVTDNDFAGFLSFLAEDAVFLAGSELRGRQAIGESWSIFFGEEAREISWRPERVAVSGDGDLGISTGPYETKMRNAQGEIVPAAGTFFSVWRRQGDGAWKIIFDGGTPPSPVEEKGGE